MSNAIEGNHLQCVCGPSGFTTENKTKTFIFPGSQIALLKFEDCVLLPCKLLCKHLSFLPFTFTRAHNMLTIPDSLPSHHLSSFQTCCLLTEATNDAKEPPWSLIFSRASCSTWHTAYTVQCHTCKGREVELLLQRQGRDDGHVLALTKKEASTFSCVVSFTLCPGKGSCPCMNLHVYMHSTASRSNHSPRDDKQASHRKSLQTCQSVLTAVMLLFRVFILCYESSGCHPDQDRQSPGSGEFWSLKTNWTKLHRTELEAMAWLPTKGLNRGRKNNLKQIQISYSCFQASAPSPF